MGSSTTSYPTSVDVLTSPVPGRASGFDTGQVRVAHDAIEAIETKLGTGSSTAASGTLLQGATGGVSSWAAYGAIGLVRTVEIDFTETAGAGTYTGSVTIPAGSTLIETVVHGVALWNNAGACTLKVGDVADDDGIFINIDLKATSLLAGEGISAAGVAGSAGGVAGADLANSQWNRRYLAGARVISGIVTTASTGGSTGRTRLTVVWSEPSSATAATKV